MNLKYGILSLFFVANIFAMEPVPRWYDTMQQGGFLPKELSNQLAKFVISARFSDLNDELEDIFSYWLLKYYELNPPGVGFYGNLIAQKFEELASHITMNQLEFLIYAYEQKKMGLPLRLGGNERFYKAFLGLPNWLQQTIAKTMYVYLPHEANLELPQPDQPSILPSVRQAAQRIENIYLNSIQNSIRWARNNPRNITAFATAGVCSFFAGYFSKDAFNALVTISLYYRNQNFYQNINMALKYGPLLASRSYDAVKKVFRIS